MRRVTWGTLLVLAGCAAMKNTLAQDLAWERWKQCASMRPFG